MKKTFVYGYFRDYMDMVHNVTICGVTMNEDVVKYSYNCDKILCIGISICNSNDKYDKEKGDRIASGRACSEKGILMTSSDGGMFNTNTVQALLENLLAYVVNNPGKYIKGYDESEKKYKEQIELNKLAETLSEDEYQYYATLARATSEEFETARKLFKN